MKNERDDASNPDLAEIRSALRDEFKPMFPELSAPASMSAEPVKAKSFECSLASTGQHDPQSFINGAQWMEDQYASTRKEN